MRDELYLNSKRTSEKEFANIKQKIRNNKFIVSWIRSILIKVLSDPEQFLSLNNSLPCIPSNNLITFRMLKLAEVSWTTHSIRPSILVIEFFTENENSCN